MQHIVIVGPGGLGGVLAGLLARTGECRVTVLGRPGAHLDAIRREGLRIQGRAEFTVAVDGVDDPAALTECDGLILAVKVQHGAAALDAVRHVDVRRFAVSLQNCTAKDDLLVAAFGGDVVVGGLAIVAAERTGPGRITWTFDGGTRFGELDGSPSARVDDLVELFATAGMDTEAAADIVGATWSKMVGWLPIGLLATLGRLPNAQVFTDPVVVPEYIGMVRELSALATAKGINLADLGPFHVDTWTRGTVATAVARAMASPLASSHSTHSAYQDVQRGEATELRACIAPLAAEADELGVPLPAVRALYAALHGLEGSL